MPDLFQTAVPDREKGDRALAERDLEGSGRRALFAALPNLTAHLAVNLRRRRLDCELTQGQLGARTGFRQNYISSLERGLRPTRTSHLDRLARALDCTVYDLLSVDPRAAAPAAHRAGDDTAHVGR
jgi:DNA-binding Xre family transcriptional regulator